MTTVHIEQIGHKLVVSTLDTVLARYALMENDDTEYLTWFVSKVLTGLGFVVEED
jgi:heme/copper-type cytochrome/quinol oxidase subunit 3